MLIPMVAVIMLNAPTLAHYQEGVSAFEAHPAIQRLAGADGSATGCAQARLYQAPASLLLAEDPLLQHAWVAPAGGTKPLFGTNPIAFGWPRGDKPPFIFDMATSAAARGEIQLHQRAGKAVPEGWGIDRDGQATTDAQAILDGAMLTFGGYKGSALAAMVELLAGPLIGDMTSAESLAWDNGAGGLPYGGELILALDPDRFLGTDAARHLARAETLFIGMQQQGARLPGERRYFSRERTIREGVNITHSLFRDISSLIK